MYLRTLRGLGSWLASGSFPVLVIGLVVFMELLLAAMLATPPGPSAFAAFASDFRTWCLGPAASGGTDWLALGSMFLSPWLLVVVVGAVWAQPLRALVRERPRALAGHVVAAALLVAGLGVGMTSAAGPAPDPDLAFPADALRTAHVAPDFALTDDRGEPLALADLAGHVTVLTAVYAHCPHTCPLVLQQARRAVESLPATDQADLRVVGVTMDPEADTPEVLAGLLQAHQLTGDTWRLVTGEAAPVNDLLDRMGVARTRDPATGVIDHANLFLVLDRQGRVAYRFGLGDLQEAWFTDALRVLLAEGPEELG